MPPRIEVRESGEGKYHVTVTEGESTSSHRVTLKPADYQRLSGGKVPAEELMRRSFEFLLEREPKEAILSSFDLTLIGRYFPEFEDVIRKRVGG